MCAFKSFLNCQHEMKYTKGSPQNNLFSMWISNPNPNCNCFKDMQTQANDKDVFKYVSVNVKLVSIGKSEQ